LYEAALLFFMGVVFAKRHVSSQGAAWVRDPNALSLISMVLYFALDLAGGPAVLRLGAAIATVVASSVALKRLKRQEKAHSH